MRMNHEIVVQVIWDHYDGHSPVRRESGAPGVCSEPTCRAEASLESRCKG